MAVSQKYAAEAKAPLLINSCTVDQQFPPEAQTQADEILGGGKFAPGYTRTYWEGCTHGFAVRGDLVRPSLPLSFFSPFDSHASVPVRNVVVLSDGWPAPERPARQGREGGRV